MPWRGAGRCNIQNLLGATYTTYWAVCTEPIGPNPTLLLRVVAVKVIKDMARTKRHHYVSQLYLRQFAAAPKQIYAFDKVTMTTKLVGIRDVAVREHFHKFPTEDIPAHWHPYLRTQFEEIARYETEDALSRLEGIYAAVLGHLLSTLDAVTHESLYIPRTLLSRDYIAVLAQFVAVSFIRTFEYRTRMREFYRKAWVSLVTTRQTDPASEVGKILPDRIWPLLHTREIFTPHMDTIVAGLLDKIWIVGVNRTALPLYTSDNPVIRRPIGLGEDVLTGFLSPGMEIAFPLTPKYILILRDRAFLRDEADAELHGKTMLLTLEDAATYNREQVLQSYRNVFSSTSNFSCAKLICSQERPDVREPDRERVRVRIEQNQGVHNSRGGNTLGRCSPVNAHLGLGILIFQD